MRSDWHFQILILNSNYFREMLEEQLARSRKRSEHVMALESEIIKYKQKLNDMALERDVDKTKLQELLDENTHLQLATKTFSSNAGTEKVQIEEEDDCASGDNSLSEQLTNNAQVSTTNPVGFILYIKSQLKFVAIFCADSRHQTRAGKPASSACLRCHA